MENLIGKKVKGFKFEKYGDLNYAIGMIPYDGKIGEITCYNAYNNSYQVRFSECVSWQYPASEIEKQLVHEYPKVMMVSDIEIIRLNKGLPRVVFMEKNGFYLAWKNAETLEESESEYEITPWKFAKDIEPEIDTKKIEPVKSTNTDNLAEKINELILEVKNLNERIVILERKNN